MNQQPSKRPNRGVGLILEALLERLQSDATQVVRAVEILGQEKDGQDAVEGSLTHVLEAKDEEGVAVRILVNPEASPEAVARLLRKAASEYLGGQLTHAQQEGIFGEIQTPEEFWLGMEHDADLRFQALYQESPPTRFFVVPEGLTLIEALDGVFQAYPTEEQARLALGPGEVVMPVTAHDEWATLDALMERRATREGQEN